MTNTELATPKLTPRRLAKIANDARKTASALNLEYISDKLAGITRIKKGEQFEYILGKSKVKDEATLDRIKKLAIPPAWESVWICASEHGHLQATGIDVLGRKQYRYHTGWNSIRNQTKFYRMLAFGEALPLIRQQLKKDLAIPEFTQAKVLSIVVTLLESTHIRVGNNQYEKLYGSYGLSTFKNKHLKVNGDKLQFVFKGKKGVLHDISISNRRLAKIVGQCKEIPGKELFQYFDVQGNKHSVDSGMVNQYIKSLSSGEFSAKDFRTWAGTLHALNFYSKIDTKELSLTGLHKSTIDMLDYVAEKLGNTRTVCKKYYVNPMLIELFENGKLESSIQKLSEIECGPHWTKDECILLKLIAK